MIFEIILTIIGIVSTIIIAALFKYPLKPEIEKIFETNMNIAVNAVFLRLEIIDDQKLEIYKIIKDNIIFKPKHPYFLCKYDTIRMIDYFKETIKSRQKDLINYMQASKYFMEPQIFAVNWYVESAHAFLEKYHLSSDENDIIAYEISKDWFNRHKNNAQDIIKTFGKLTNDKFKHKWNKEFSKYNYNLQ